jgi:deazaflavin-dependent oxidoreductase (nitroreductase family)
MINRLGSTRLGVWTIKHIISPSQRWFYQLTAGKYFRCGTKNRQILLLTTQGRRTGKERTTPIFFLRDGDRLVICNVNPGYEHTNPWVLNLRANPLVKVQICSDIQVYHAREIMGDELDCYWPRLVQIWPAYQDHFSKSGQRAVFILERALTDS